MKKTVYFLSLMGIFQSAMATDNCKSILVEVTDKLERVAIISGRSAELNDQLKKSNIKNEKVNEVSVRAKMLEQVNLNGQEEVGNLLERFSSNCLN